jgi:hypothetical protein
MTIHCCDEEGHSDQLHDACMHSYLPRQLWLLVSQTITASTGPVIVVKGEALWRCLDYVGEMETSAHKRHHLSLLR